MASSNLRARVAGQGLVDEREGRRSNGNSRLFWLALVEDMERSLSVPVASVFLNLNNLDQSFDPATLRLVCGCGERRWHNRLARLCEGCGRVDVSVEKRLLRVVGPPTCSCHGTAVLFQTKSTDYGRVPISANSVSVDQKSSQIGVHLLDLVDRGPVTQHLQKWHLLAVPRRGHSCAGERGDHVDRVCDRHCSVAAVGSRRGSNMYPRGGVLVAGGVPITLRHNSIFASLSHMASPSP